MLTAEPPPPPQGLAWVRGRVVQKAKGAEAKGRGGWRKPPLPGDGLGQGEGRHSDGPSTR